MSFFPNFSVALQKQDARAVKEGDVAQADKNVAGSANAEKRKRKRKRGQKGKKAAQGAGPPPSKAPRKAILPTPDHPADLRHNLGE